MNFICNFLFFTFFLFSCGKDKSVDKSIPVDNNTVVNSNGTIKAFDSIPYSCDKSAQGNIIFLKENGFRVCTAQNEWQPIDLKGDAGPQGFTGPKGGSALVSVYDAQDRKIGWLVDSSKTATCFGCYVVLLTAGGTVELLSNGYIKSVYNFANCFYESNDCSGTCRADRPDSIIRYGNILVDNDVFRPRDFYLSASTDLGRFTYASSGGPLLCGAISGTLQTSFAASPLKLQSGASYPFGQISLKAE